MPENLEGILDYLRNRNHLPGLENLRDDEDNEMYRAIHLKIVSDINNLGVSDAEKTELFTDYYKNIKTILTGVFDKRALNGNTPLIDDKVQIGLPFFGSQDWNLLILGKFPGKETLKHKDEGLGYLYFLDKTNWFRYLMHYIFNAGKKGEEIIKQIEDEKYDGLFDLQSSLLEDNHIAIGDMVHLCYSVGGSSSDDKRIPISYSKIGDLLLRRLRFNENMDIDIVIWGNRDGQILKYGNMTYLDFISIEDRKPINLSGDFIDKLEGIGLEKKNIKVSNIKYGEFKKKNVFEVKIKHNGFTKKIRVILGYDSSASAMSRKKGWKKDKTGYKKFINRQSILWNKYKCNGNKS